RALPSRRDARGRIGPRAEPGPCAGAGPRRPHRAHAPSGRRHGGDLVLPARRGGTGGRLMELLLVEDDERVSRFIRRGLEAEGYSVTAARDGVAGLQRAQAESYDVL